MTPDELVQRVAVTLRTEIGPAVSDPEAKTQAFMAAVVLEKLGRQLRTADAHARADRADVDELVRQLDGRLAGSNGDWPAALDQLRRAGAPGLNAFVATVHAHRGDLGPADFDAVITRVRAVLRKRLDRQLDYSR
jgi:hypothetical protein